MDGRFSIAVDLFLDVGNSNEPAHSQTRPQPTRIPEYRIRTLCYEDARIRSFTVIYRTVPVRVRYLVCGTQHRLVLFRFPCEKFWTGIVFKFSAEDTPDTAERRTAWWQAPPLPPPPPVFGLAFGNNKLQNGMRRGRLVRHLFAAEFRARPAVF